MSVREMVNVHEAKTHLSRLLERVRRGDEVVIALRGVPFAKLVPYAAEQESRGALLGSEKSVKVSDDFELPLAEIEELFYGE